MSDEIKPAFSPEEWARFHNGGLAMSIPRHTRGNPKVSLPDGYVCIALRDCDGPDGRQLVTVSEKQMHQVVERPDEFRVVSQTMVDEYAALCKRHDAELEQIWARIHAAPSFKVTVSLTA